MQDKLKWHVGEMFVGMTDETELCIDISFEENPALLSGDYEGIALNRELLMEMLAALDKASPR